MRTSRDAGAARVMNQLKDDWWAGITTIQNAYERAPRRTEWDGLIYHSRILDQLDAGLVLADALEEKGYSKLANELRAHTARTKKRLQAGGQLVFTDQSYSLYRSLEKRLRHAIDEIDLRDEKKSEEIWWWLDPKGYAYPIRPLRRGEELSIFELLVPSRTYGKRAELYNGDVHPFPPKGSYLARGAARFVRSRR